MYNTTFRAKNYQTSENAVLHRQQIIACTRLHLRLDLGAQEEVQKQAWKVTLVSAGSNKTVLRCTIINTCDLLQNTVVGNSRGVSNISALAASDPASVNPLIGYHLLYGVTKASQLSSGMTFNTTDTIKTFGADDRTLSISIPASNQVSPLPYISFFLPSFTHRI